MSGTIMPAPWFTGLDDNGDPVYGGKLYTYAAGTSTPLATWSDSELQIPHPNPVVLDGGGRASVYLGANSYKFILKDANDVTIRSQDNISATAPYAVNQDIAAVAGETLPAGSVVFLADDTTVGTQQGRWYLTDADVADRSSLAAVIGVVPVTILMGSTGSVRLQGRVTVEGPLQLNAPYYASGIPGKLIYPAPVPPAFERLVGVSDSLSTIVLVGGGSSTVMEGDVNIGGDITVAGQTNLDDDLVFTGDYSVRRNTLDGADNGRIQLCGGGGPFIPGGPDQTRGAIIHLYGNDRAELGSLILGAGNAGGHMQCYTGPANTLRMTILAGGGVNIGGGFADPGAGNLFVQGGRVLFGSSTVVRMNTADGADDNFLILTAGGGDEAGRGASLVLFGAEFTSAGVPGGTATLSAVGDGYINFVTGGTRSVRIWKSGAMSLGGNDFEHTEPDFIFVALAGVDPAPGKNWTRMQGGGYLASVATVAPADVMQFYNGSGIHPVGVIQTVGPECRFINVSDARLKTDLGVARETDVLAKAVIHDFQWKNDGTVGRGVFAQEAIEALPSAVSVGCEGPVVDEAWGVDYSKFVPDLIVGWQQHERTIADLRAELARLREQLLG